MKTRIILGITLPLATSLLMAANNQILGWNNLGMHCMDSDYSVFSILPPYNTIEAQLIVSNKLVTNGSGYTVTYQAIADPTGSFNSTSVGKGNYAQYVQPLFGANVTADQGLAGWNMPGTNNAPQSMLFEQTNQPAPGAHPEVLTLVNWWRAEGIPISPYDDAHNKNTYPMMRLIAKNPSNQPIATNDIVLPVSDEMDCRACHASGSVDAAKPAAGWVWSGNPERDFRLNILRLHDEHQFALHSNLYQAALADRPAPASHFNPQGLYLTVVADNKPVLCAACHQSEALGMASFGTTPQLTTSIHAFHAHVIDPVTSMTLDSSANRSACYRCHPGSATKCLRGAMGGAIAADGSMEMQCQSCHGNMSNVGSSDRLGWFMEPKCQECHTGTATHNNGQIRYTSCFTNSTWGARIAVDQTFATQPNTPPAGVSLYRFSAGHGGLQCSACHGSTHAEFPATHVNDNVRNIKIQGHAGVMVECTSCHTTMPANSTTAVGGPHGMHPISSSWAGGHNDIMESGGISRTLCQACHGGDFRGTVLSRSMSTNSFTTDKFGAKKFWLGRIISCYDCHDGAYSSNPSSHSPATVASVTTNTVNNVPVTMVMTRTDSGSDSLTFRIISQPAHGSVAVSNNIATYLPEPGFVGTETFTFAAYNGWVDSINLATGTVSVVQGPFSIGVVAHAPTNSPVNWPVAFAAVPSVTNYSGPVTFSWNFGDGSATVTNQFPSHTYISTGTFFWNVSATVSNVTANAGGGIEITGPVALRAQTANGQLAIVWPASSLSGILEESAGLGADAHWTAVTNPAVLNGSYLNVMVQPDGTRFFRVRQAW